MDEKICVDIFTDRYEQWMRKYNVKNVIGKKSSYYTITIEPQDKSELLKHAKRHHIRYRCYERRWGRSSNYRDNFIKYNKPPYRCRYCRKKLTLKTMVVDHIVPVAKTKSSAKARHWLTIRGINDVNDIRNLAPSCIRCNYKKGDKMGRWVLRGLFGNYKLFWILHYSFYIALFFLAVYSLFSTKFIITALSIL